MKSIIQANDSITSNSKQLDVLKQHFPNCFDKHGAFIPAKLQAIVEASGVALSKEGYSLNWLGKSYARLLANENVRTLLKANTEHNNLPENASSQNMLIKGDNVEVLKHLMGAYSGKVKMIYIDPPYNTGSDGFVYHDDRKFTAEQLSHLAGIDEDEAKRILEFTSSGSNSHSAWLTFMYPRLYLAKQLLRDDGVIFISIDDNEQAQLKLLCDEVFGEENFVNSFVWKKNSSGKTVSRQFPINIEYIFMCAKSNNYELNNVYKPLSAATIASYSKDDEDGRGKYCTVSLQKTKQPGPETTYDYVDNNGKVWLCPLKGWRMVKSKVKSLENDGRLYFSGETLREKRYWNERENEGQIADTLWDDLAEGNVGTSELKKIFEQHIFDNPKPIDLISRVLNITTNKKDAAIVLDFFAGSGTTAHAVMQFNAEDGGNRQFICVQLDEVTDPKSEAHKAGYKTIYDITAERIKRAAAKIKAAHPEAQCDFGFKQFETIPVFDGYLDEPDELTPQLELFNAHKLSAEERHCLMLTWQAQDGIALNTTLTPLDLAGYTAYQGGRLVYFIEPDLTLDAIVAFLERLDNDVAFIPNQLVVLGYLLDSKTQREMTEAVKQYNNRKGIELTLDVRF